MNATFEIFLDTTDDKEVVWWADTDDISGFTAVASSLMELRTLVEEAVALYLDADTVVALRLVAEVPEADSENEPVEIPKELRANLFVAPLVRQTVVTVS